MRGAPADWDGLAARGNPGWSWADVLPAYRAMEDHSLGASETRGAGGPLGVSVTDTGDEVTAAILASAVSYGWEHVADANASDAERIGFTPSTIARGRRTTSYDAYVRPVLARQAAAAPGRGGRRPGGTAAGSPSPPAPAPSGCCSTAAASPGSRTIDAKGRSREVTARREVILCAGSVETPLLLERSGIGRPQLLSKHGIEPDRRVAERRRAPHRAARRRPPGDAQRPRRRGPQAQQPDGPGGGGAPLAGDRHGPAGHRRLRPGLPVQVGPGRATPRRPGPVRPDGPGHDEQGHEAGPAPRHPVHGLPDPAGDDELGAHLGRRAGRRAGHRRPFPGDRRPTGRRWPRCWDRPRRPRRGRRSPA